MTEGVEAVRRGVDRMLQGLGLVAAVVLFAMMGLTTLDVGARYLFNAPLRGAFEITELLLGVLIFTGLPLTTRRREHVTVDLLDRLFRGAVDRMLTWVVDGGSALILIGIGGQLWSRADRFAETGRTTNTLEIAIAPVAYLMAVMSFLAALVIILMLLSGLGRSQAVTDET